VQVLPLAAQVLHQRPSQPLDSPLLRYLKDMTVAAPIPVEDYLATAYDPDLEYVDGALVERNLGDWLHALIQSNLIYHLRRKYPHIKVVPELRAKSADTRYRLPDVCALLAAPETKYLVEAAFLAVEILSEEDRMTKVMEKLEEYDKKGVSHIWLIDPRLQTIAVYSGGALREVRGEAVATGDPRLELTRAEIFQK
jgi:Uma2 family endonuclease